MTLDVAEFIRRFLLHVLRSGFHRIPPLPPVRRHGSGSQHRARPPSARIPRGLARERARRGRQRGPNTFPSAAMPVLRRRDAHRRDVRRPRAPRARRRRPGSGSTPHDRRHASCLTTPIASTSSPRRNRKAMSSQGQQTLFTRRTRARPSHPRDRTSSSSSFPSTRPSAYRLSANARARSVAVKSPEVTPHQSPKKPFTEAEAPTVALFPTHVRCPRPGGQGEVPRHHRLKAVL